MNQKPTHQDRSKNGNARTTIQKKTPYHDPVKQHDGKSISGELICKYCHAIYQDKHWQPLENLDPKLIDRIQKGICPACHLERQHLSDGVVHLMGAFVGNHLEEIKNLIENIGELEEKRDILNRIERIEQKNGGITVYTSKNQLAVEIGKKVSNAHKGGKLDIQWSKEDKPVDVTWNKD